MSLHVFANIITPFGTAANNRGDNQGANITPLQKLIWLGQPHTTVSAEAIRFAIRRRLKAAGLPCNRHWAEHLSEIPDAVRAQLAKAYKGDIKVPCGYFVDPDFAWYADPNATGFTDDDLLGFMSAEAAKEEAEGIVEESAVEPETAEQENTAEAAKEEAEGIAENIAAEPETAEQEKADVQEQGRRRNKRKPKKKGTANVRRAVLEVTRAVSLTPWTGDVTFNAASSGATPSAQKKGSNPVPYGTEVHATRYQYGIALTPERLRDKSRAANALVALCTLGPVAGNHGRFLFDFSPDAVVFRFSSDPAPRILYCFETDFTGKTITADAVVKRLAADDVTKDELILGVSDLDSSLADQFKKEGITPFGVKAACAEAVKRINTALTSKR